MENYTHIPFDVSGTEFEVRISCENSIFTVRAYCDDKPANKFTYTVDVGMACDIASAQGIDPLKSLVELAKSDVRGGDTMGT